MKADDAIVSEGNLDYYCGQSTVVSVETSLAKVKLCRIQFGSDGSIYVPFPYLNSKRGLVSEVTDHPPVGGPFTYDLGKHGVVVDYDVKFSHHTSGIVRFSRSGQEDVLPRRKSFPLATEIGQIFQLQIHRLSGLEWVTKPQPKDVPLVFSFPNDHPVGVKVIVGWRRKDDIRWSGRPVGVKVGPRSEGFHKKTREVHRWAFLGQPPTSPLRDHVLMIAVEAVPALEGGDVPTMVFLGGFDPHEIKPDRTLQQSTNFLAFMYPFHGTQRAVVG